MLFPQSVRLRLLALAGMLSLLLLSAQPVVARVPTPPHTVYGLIAVTNGSGTQTRQLDAHVNGVVASSMVTTVGVTALPYTIQLPADDPATPAVEGGVSGSSIEFRSGTSLVIPSQVIAFQPGGRSRVDLSVEDGTAVVLDYFAALGEGEGRVALNWATATEVNHAGFLIYRIDADGAETRVTEQLIASRGVNGQGANYETMELDVPNGTWLYVLEDVDLANIRTRHEPVAVVVSVPTVVSFGRNAATATLPHAPLVFFTVLLVLTLVRFGRNQPQNERGEC